MKFHALIHIIIKSLQVVLVLRTMITLDIILFKIVFFCLNPLFILMLAFLNIVAFIPWRKFYFAWKILHDDFITYWFKNIIKLFLQTKNINCTLYLITSLNIFCIFTLFSSFKVNSGVFLRLLLLFVVQIPVWHNRRIKECFLIVILIIQYLKFIIYSILICFWTKMVFVGCFIVDILDAVVGLLHWRLHHVKWNCLVLGLRVLTHLKKIIII